MRRSPDPERRLWWDLHAPDPLGSRFAAHLLSSLMKQRGKRVAAERLLRDSLKAHGPRGAVGTWIRLARLLEEEGRVEEAERAYREVLRWASVEETPEALMDLAAYWARGKEVDRARGLYLRLVEGSATASIRALAAYRVARIELNRNESRRAAISLRRSLQEADATLLPRVLVDLGQILVEDDSLDEGLELLSRAVASNDPDQAPRAALLLGTLRRRQGDHLEAYRFLQLVIESEHPRYEPRAQAEQDELIHSELNALLKPNFQLVTPSSKKNRLTRLARFDSSVYMFVLPIFKRDLLETWVECERSWIQSRCKDAFSVDHLSFWRSGLTDLPKASWSGLGRVALQGVERDRGLILRRLYIHDQLTGGGRSLTERQPGYLSQTVLRGRSLVPLVSARRAVGLARMFELCEGMLLAWLARRLLADGNLRMDGHQDPQARLVWPTFPRRELRPDPERSPLGLDLPGLEAGEEFAERRGEWLWHCHPPPVNRRWHAVTALARCVFAATTPPASVTNPLHLSCAGEEKSLLDRDGIEFVSSAEVEM
jgi:tetratricopeptide (TPR) repeat protein